MEKEPFIYSENQSEKKSVESADQKPAKGVPDKGDLIKEFTRRSIVGGWGQMRRQEELAKLGLLHKSESKQEILKPDELPEREESTKSRKTGLGDLTEEEAEVLARRNMRRVDTEKLGINPDSTPEEIEAAEAEQKAQQAEERRTKGIQKFGLPKDSTLEDTLDAQEEEKRLGIVKKMDISPNTTLDEIRRIQSNIKKYGSDSEGWILSEERRRQERATEMGLDINSIEKEIIEKEFEKRKQRAVQLGLSPYASESEIIRREEEIKKKE